ncbi:MAG: hypothetical protein M3X11_02290, partial [Acidobacteriota bacterium]|nr:hypothetical protein [Acidobacteriota bacterium]
PKHSITPKMTIKMTLLFRDILVQVSVIALFLLSKGQRQQLRETALETVRAIYQTQLISRKPCAFWTI